MQKKKEDINDKILSVARNEFIANAYKNTSMRTIAKKANVGLSNIYNYFKNKDEIFRAVLLPLLNAIEESLEKHNSSEYIDINIFSSEEYQRVHIDEYVDLILRFREEFKLLLFKSSGSSLENYRDEYTNKHSIMGQNYMDQMKSKYPQINNNLSHFFIHTMSSWWLTNIGEIVSHNLSKEEIEQFISEYMAFATAGWKELMNA
ncbi:MAG: TetR/AcrR family transcriptional regulator [Bacteroidales bacterium]|nr:TetR/AcrR family transcriptional regulator [Bacteroidales bacterium]